MDEQTKFVLHNDITEYNDRELSQHFLNVETLHIRMITEDVVTLRQIAEDNFIFTEAQWKDLLATREEWIGEEEPKYIAEPCPKCKGYGWIGDTSLQGYKDCRHCNKTGYKRREK